MNKYIRICTVLIIIVFLLIPVIIKLFPEPEKEITDHANHANNVTAKDIAQELLDDALLDEENLKKIEAEVNQEITSEDILNAYRDSIQENLYKEIDALGSHNESDQPLASKPDVTPDVNESKNVNNNHEDHNLELEQIVRESIKETMRKEILAAHVAALHEQLGTCTPSSKNDGIKN